MVGYNMQRTTTEKSHVALATSCLAVAAKAMVRSAQGVFNTRATSGWETVSKKSEQNNGHGRQAKKHTAGKGIESGSV